MTRPQGRVVERLAVGAAPAWRPRRRRPAWVEALDCADPRTGVRASARVWRAVLLEFGAGGFEDLPVDRVTLKAVVDRVKAALPPSKRGRKRAVRAFERPGLPRDFGKTPGD